MHKPVYVTVTSAALTLGLPVTWLKREVDAGRLPSVRAGRRTLVSMAAIREALSVQADDRIGRDGMEAQQ